MAFVSPFKTPSVRFHWPIHGPQAFARTVPPAEENVSNVESRASVARICSLPGVTKKSAFSSKPAADACLTMSSALVISWYELFVQLPINPAPKDSGHSLILTASLNCDRGVERSGVNGPFIWGSRVDRSMTTTSSYTASESARSKWPIGDISCNRGSLCVDRR